MDWDLTEVHMDDLYALEKNQNMDVFSSSGVLENRILSELSEQKHSSKNPRASCLVDGCRADLSGCRDYNRRHRVCETHSKTPIVTIAGKEQRFCQQCSRFHSLGEFDEVKRSCRKRLDGHNRRRRKSKTESTYFNYHRGTKLLHFGGGSDEEKIPSNSYARFRCVREKRFPFLLDKVNDSFFEPKAKGKGVLYLLSSSNHKMHHGSGTGPTPANNHQLQLNGSVIHQHWVNRDRIVSADWDHSLLD